MNKEVKKAVGKLELLRGKGSSLTDSDKREIESLHEQVLDRPLTRTSCNSCYEDAVIMLLLYIRRNGKFKEKCSFRLKNGVLLQMEFGSSDFYTNDNLTDKVARKYLAKHPENINLFAEYPEEFDQEEAPEEYQEEVPEELGEEEENPEEE